MKREIAFLSVILLACVLIAPPHYVEVQDPEVIVIDYSHGNTRATIEATEDLWLDGNLTALGYDVIWAKGGINSTVLADADALILGSTFNIGYSAAEVAAIASWYGYGKFLWVATDSDYDGAYINHNASLILEALGSHVYGEELIIWDLESNTGANYRCVANTTSDDPYVSDIVDDVTGVLFHGPTCLIGSTDGTFDGATLDLMSTEIPWVYPVLYYSAAAYLTNSDLVDGKVYDVDDQGSFAAMTVEYLSGGLLAVSGATPYGDYQPMYTDSYYGYTLDGSTFVHQMIEFGINQVVPTTTTTPPPTTSTTPTTSTMPTTSTTSTTTSTMTTTTTTPTTTVLPLRIDVFIAGVSAGFAIVSVVVYVWLRRKW